MKKNTLFLLIAMFGFSALFAQNSPVVQKAKYFRKTEPLIEMEVIASGPRDRSWKDNIIRNEINIKLEREKKENSLPLGPDPVLQDFQGTLMQSRAAIQNFDGIDNVDGVYPPDTDGDVSPDHYFQMINLSFAIWDKDGNKLYGPVANSTLWNGFIGPWTGTNDGDPIVLYDEEADRWLASQFAINTGNGTYWELVAISESSDPLGSWYQYAFQYPAFNDYPKFGIWHDAYYASFNMFGNDYVRAAVSTYERDKMLAGDSAARMILFDLPPGSDPFSLLPADFDGDEPDPAEPNYFIYFNDDQWGYPQDQLRIYEFDVDWTNPASSTFIEAYTLPTAPFDSELCSAPRGRCIDQPNTNTKLESLSDRMMYRLQYRDFGSYQVMVTNHTVDVGGGQAGIRWYELRNNNDGNGWIIHQQGTYAPDEHNRWMGSIAMNANGEIALGYTVSSDEISPSVRYTAQTPDADSGIMNIAEVELVSGSGAQTSISRWGDYSMMSVDPSDDTTFWFTQEYLQGGWATRISSFNLEPAQPATANAGNNDTTCQNNIFITSGSGQNYNSVYWESMGDGIFGNPYSLTANYWRGYEDLENGQVKLVLNANSYIPGEIARDTMILYFQMIPEAFAGNDTTICDDEVLLLDGQAENDSAVLWTTSGDGVFENDTALNASYTPGFQDVQNGSVQLFLTAFARMPCDEDDIDQITVTVDNCTGIQEAPDIPLSAKIVPNPNKGLFTYTIRSGYGEQLHIEIHNNMGEIIYNKYLISSGKAVIGEVNIEDHPKGLYLFKIYSEREQLVKKVLNQ
ncbi:MAG: T9SS type A sorting domain-containing protein [Bacteroidales bacterium]|nr:T9SS type A sorting domain-containing protein [Bacteroidales bacterium]MCF8386374.1 T9SS type A sorting domain-containing protein [Bacteroidales bacterium]MCF8396784.1 T9SS type A sorting domain-containing protein [Bacteroidales bacterium]